MQRLKTQVMEIIDAVNQNWVQAIKEADNKKEGINVTDVMGKFSKNIMLLDEVFKEAAGRNQKKPGGYLNIFGGLPWNHKK